MAATQISRTPSLTGAGSLSKTRGILIETMQLVEPKKELPVPNHLLDTKIYSKVAQNAVVQARPAVIHFGGFEPGKTHRQIIQLSNVSTEVQRMHIIPPQTKYFYAKYTKSDRLVPGLNLDCVIEFYPDEWRYYYDCIRIHTKGEENLVIPIHAYPVMNTRDFPEFITFPAVPVGHSMSKVVPLQCQAPIDFEFQLNYLQPHSAFVVDPMAGIVPANGEVDITVTFSPSEFSTARMKLQLVISQFNSKPLVCTFTGSSEPGLAKILCEETVPEPQSEYEGSLLLDPRAISPLARARRNKLKSQKQVSKSRGTLMDDRPQEIEYAGIKFPINLNTPHAVAQVLNQEAGKLRIKDLREAVLSKKGGSTAATRQMKEAMFEMAVRQDVYEERQNQLRWQVKLGDDQISPIKRSEVLEDREASWREYRLRRGDPVMEVEYGRTCSDCIMRRTRRDFLDVADDTAKFDTYTNDMWAVRHTTLDRFKQAARKVIIRNRAETKLRSLRQMMIDWGNKKYTNNVTGEEKDKLMEEEESEDASLENTYIQSERVKSFNFPTYAPPNVKDDMAVDALGKVKYQPTEVIVKKKVPYFPLKVPQQYNLMGYRGHNVHDASLSYVPATMMRTLLTGAEDELITIQAPELAEPAAIQSVVNEGDMQVEDLTLVKESSVQEIVPLKPPQALFRPIDYPALHIFNPAPGLQVFQPPLPYAETDADFHLCPLPRYTSTDLSNPHMSTQKQYLDREDTIKGIMSWKRFPSQGLTSLSNTPTLTNVWVPRWNDPFGQELLSEDVPQLLNQLPEEDGENILDEDELEERGHMPALTPGMVNAEFAMIKPSSAPPPEEKAKKEDIFPHGNKMPPTNIPVSASGPVPRERRERELEYFLKRKYNRLGNKYRAKVTGINAQKTNSSLILN